MKFKTLDEATQYFKETYGDDLSNLEISVTDVITESTTIPAISSIDVELNSLGGNPTIKAKRNTNLTENVLYVKSYESVPMSCGTGKVSFMDREFYSNICEMDNSAGINLDITAGDGTITNTYFKLILESERSPEDSDVLMVLGK